MSRQALTLSLPQCRHIAVRIRKCTNFKGNDMTLIQKHSALVDSDDEFHASVLGLYLDEMAQAVRAHGTIVCLDAGMSLPVVGELGLCVVLAGRLSSADDWFGPGNHFQAPLSENDTGAMTADLDGTLVWMLDMASPAWRAPSNLMLQRALTHALIAADAAELAAAPPAQMPDPATLCDHDHPEIRRRAVRLRRATPASTARAIFDFVQSMSYRFGHWHERASDTLRRGVGMCTTKANLQVALMRAAGLEAGFVETPMPMSKLGKLMPDAWLALMRNEVRHYFAAVKLDGTWWACDASYDDTAFNIYIETMPELSFLIPAYFDKGRPYSPAYEAKGADPTDITVVPHLRNVMGKPSRFGARHFEALNTRVDRARAAHRRQGHLAGIEVSLQQAEVSA